MSKAYPLGISRDDKHVYRYTDDKGSRRLPGVTTIIGKALDKSPGLVGWAKRTVAENAVERIDLLNRVIEMQGEKAAIDWLKAQPDQHRDKAASLGTKVHFIAEQIANDLPVEIDDESGPFIDAYLEWYGKVQPRIIATETYVYDLDIEYAGQADVWMEFDGQPYIVDYKTGTNVYPHEVVMQLGAYDLAREWNLTEKKPHVAGGLVLHVRPEGVTPHWFSEQDIINGQSAFLAALSIYEYSKMKLGEGND